MLGPKIFGTVFSALTVFFECDKQMPTTQGSLRFSVASFCILPLVTTVTFLANSLKFKSCPVVCTLELSEPYHLQKKKEKKDVRAVNCSHLILVSF